MDSRQGLIFPLGVCTVVLERLRCTRRAPLNIADNDFEIDEETARFYYWKLYLFIYLSFLFFHIWVNRGFEIDKELAEF